MLLGVCRLVLVCVVREQPRFWEGVGVLCEFLSTTATNTRGACGALKGRSQTSPGLPLAQRLLGALGNSIKIEGSLKKPLRPPRPRSKRKVLRVGVEGGVGGEKRR